jgi:hypothetical protein
MNTYADFESLADRYISRHSKFKYDDIREAFPDLSTDSIASPASFVVGVTILLNIAIALNSPKKDEILQFIKNDESFSKIKYETTISDSKMSSLLDATKKLLDD